MDIVEDIKQQIDENRMELDLKGFYTSEIYYKMNNACIDIRYKVLFSLLTDQSLHWSILEFANSNYPWVSIQDYGVKLPMFYAHLQMDAFRKEKIIDLTSSNFYKILINNMLVNHEVFSDDFINHYINIDDLNTTVLWSLLANGLNASQENYGIIVLKCYLRLSEIKPLVFNRSLLDEENEEDDFGVEPRILFYKELLKNHFPTPDTISNMEVLEFFVQNNKILDTNTEDNDYYRIIVSLIGIFNTLSLSEQIYFGSNICKLLSQCDILFHASQTICHEFTDYVFDNYPVNEWFDRDFLNVDVYPYFCQKLLISSSSKDKILMRVLTDETNTLRIFPNINHYDVNNLVKKVIDGHISYS